MPSSATITAFYSFTALTTIRSSEVNNNFSNFRGHIIPVDPTATSSPHITYDLGSIDHGWRRGYIGELVLFSVASGVQPSTTTGYSVYIKSSDGKAYKKDSTGLETQLGGGALVVTGTPSSPSTITAAGGITFTQSSGERQIIYCQGDTTTGTDITANPQITAGTSTSYNLELILYGTSDTRTIQLDDGNGVSLNGSDCVLYSGSILHLLWNGSSWVELYRKV